MSCIYYVFQIKYNVEVDGKLPMEVGACAQLIKKRDDPASAWKGIKFYLVDKDGKPEYDGEPLILWKNDSEALFSGFVREVPVYLGEAYVPKKSK